jgi:hypothetical protein
MEHGDQPDHGLRTQGSFAERSGAAAAAAAAAKTRRTTQSHLMTDVGWLEKCEDCQP